MRRGWGKGRGLCGGGRGKWGASWPGPQTRWNSLSHSSIAGRRIPQEANTGGGREKSATLTLGFPARLGAIFSPRSLHPGRKLPRQGARGLQKNRKCHEHEIDEVGHAAARDGG